MFFRKLILRWAKIHFTVYAPVYKYKNSFCVLLHAFRNFLNRSSSIAWSVLHDFGLHHAKLHCYKVFHSLTLLLSASLLYAFYASPMQCNGIIFKLGIIPVLIPWPLDSLLSIVAWILLLWSIIPPRYFSFLATFISCLCTLSLVQLWWLFNI